MYLEGMDEMLFGLDADPLERKNLVASPEYARQLAELRELAMQGWDPDRLRGQIEENQAERLFIHRATQGAPTYVFTLSDDDSRKYVSNAGAVDTKARARFPYLELQLPSALADH